MALPEVVLGVDFGHSNSVVAAFDVIEASAEVVANDIGGRTTPSCVCFEEGGGRLVGESALRCAVSEPASTVRGVKSILGVRFSTSERRNLNSVALKGSGDSDAFSMKIGNSTYAAEEVAGALLMELKKGAEGNLIGKKIKKAVIAVPSYFNASQRCAVQNAASLAGLELQQLVNETTAAAVFFAHDRGGSRKVVILDVGGGGGSVAVVQLEDNAVKVLAHCGTKLPGGEQFDDKMIEFLVQAVKKCSGVKEVTDPRGLEILRSQWEQAKKKLSRIPKATVSAFLPGTEAVDFRRDVTRSEFEEQCRDLFQCISKELSNTLSKAKVKPDDVDDVLLVGGSTRIPLLRTLVQEALGGKQLCKAVNPDEAVALGAALLGAGQVELVEERLGLYTQVMCGGRLLDGWSLNHPLPTSPTSRFAEEPLEVRQGEHPTSGMHIIYLKRKFPRHCSDFTLAVSVEGTIILSNPKEGSKKLSMQGCLSHKCHEDLAKKMEKYAKQDEVEARRLKAKNACEELLRQVVSWKIIGNSPCLNEANKLNEYCRKKLDWLKEHGEAGSDAFGKLHKDVERMFHELQDKLKAEEGLDEAKELLQVALQSVLLTEVSEDELCRNKTLELRNYCMNRLSWLKENSDRPKEDYDSIRREIEEKKEKLNVLRQSERERLEAVEKLRAAAELGLAKSRSTDHFFGQYLGYFKEKRSMLQSRYLTKEECHLQREEILKMLEVTERNRQQAIVEQRRVDLRNSLKERVNELTALVKENGDNSEAGHDYRSQIQRLYQEYANWLKQNDAVSEHDFNIRLVSLNLLVEKVKGEYDHKRRAAQAEKRHAIDTLKRRLQSVVDSAVADDHEAKVAALSFQQNCRDKLQNLPFTKLTKQACDEVLDEIKKDEARVQQKQRVERERRTLHNEVKTRACKAREQYKNEPLALHICDRVESWLASNPTADGEKVKSVSGQMEEAFGRLGESLRLQEAASREADTAVQARQQCCEAANALLAELGMQADVHLSATATAGLSQQQGYSPQDYTAAGEPMDIDEPPSRAEALKRALLQSSRWPADLGEQLGREAEALAVEALREARAAGCLALMAYKAVFAERERLALCARYVRADGLPVERLLLLRAVRGAGQPQGGPADCARRLADALRQGEQPRTAKSGAMCQLVHGKKSRTSWTLCQRAEVKLEEILVGMSIVGAGQEGRALKEELARGAAALQDGAVTLGQRLAMAIQEGIADDRSVSPRRMLYDFFLTIDTLRELFTFGGQQFQLLKAKCSTLKDGDNPWATYEEAVRFVAAEGSTGLQSALKELAASHPTSKKIADVIAQEVSRIDFASCLATCKVLFRATSYFESFVSKLDTLTLPNSMTFFKSSLHLKRESLLVMVEREMVTSYWSLLYESQVTGIVNLCVDLMAGISGEYLNGLRGRIQLREEICALKRKDRRFWSSSTTLKAFGKEATANFDAFTARHPSQLVSLQSMASAMAPEEKRELPHLHSILTRELTAPLTAPVGPRAWDQLRQGARFAARCGCPEDVAEAVIVLAALRPDQEASQ